MEWIEVTGKSVAEAKELALDRLGVSDDDLEFEVVSEPKSGFLGVGRSDARIRARVKPVSRDKPDTRRRSRGRTNDRRSRRGRSDKSEPQVESSDSPKSESKGTGSPSRSKSTKPRTPKSGSSKRRTESQGEKTTMSNDDEGASLQEQCAATIEFLEGVVDAFEITATVSAAPGEEYVEAKIEGDDLGRLIGPEGVTLNALEELTRAVVKTRSGGTGGRVRVDVAGYREARRAALEAFTRERVDQALDTGTDVVLEPMGSGDRKVVHDVVAELQGVSTSSEGEEPRRRVVIHPFEA